MADTSREKILKSLMADIAAIKGAGPYSTTINRVTRRPHAPSEVQKPLTPWVDVIRNTQRWENKPTEWIRVEDTFTLQVFTAGTTREAAEDLLDDVLDDIVHALYANPYRTLPPDGNAAHNTFINGTTQTYFSEEGIAAMTVEVEVWYTRCITSGTEA